MALLSKKLLLALAFAFSVEIANAQVDHGPPINVTVKVGGTVRITRQFMVGPFCGFDGPSINAFQNPKLGTIKSEITRQKIPPNTNLTGDGHSFCNKETGVTSLYYKAGNTIGKDEFDIVIQYGRASRFQKVNVKIQK